MSRVKLKCFTEKQEEKNSNIKREKLVSSWASYTANPFARSLAGALPGARFGSTGELSPQSPPTIPRFKVFLNFLFPFRIFLLLR